MSSNAQDLFKITGNVGGPVGEDAGPHVGWKSHQSGSRRQHTEYVCAVSDAKGPVDWMVGPTWCGKLAGWPGGGGAHKIL